MVKYMANEKFHIHGDVILEYITSIEIYLLPDLIRLYFPMLQSKNHRIICLSCIQNKVKKLSISFNFPLINLIFVYNPCKKGESMKSFAHKHRKVFAYLTLQYVCIPDQSVYESSFKYILPFH